MQIHRRLAQLKSRRAPASRRRGRAPRAPSYSWPSSPPIAAKPALAERPAVVVDDGRVHADGERLRRRLPGLERLDAGLGLRHVEGERHVAHGGAVGLVGERGLRVEGEREHRRRALFGRRIDQPARHDAGHEAVPARVLLDVADAPRRAARVQVYGELGVVLARERIELAGPAP